MAPMEMIDRPSPNHGPRRGGARPTMIVLHHTAMESAAASLERLTDPAAQVSAHYLIEECGAVHRLVDEDRQAWHAGASFWAGTRDVNSASIGVELQNTGRAPYPAAQVAATAALCRGVMRRHEIAHVLAHSDVAPARKADPGAHFPWARLAAEGVGRMPRAGAEPVPEEGARAALLALGYDPDCGTPALLRALQRHWAPPVTGRACRRTRAALAGMV